MIAYRIEAASVAALVARIEAADPYFVVTGDGGVKRVRQSRVTNPRRVMVDGAPVDDGNGGTYTPKVPANPEAWFSTIRTDENKALAAIASDAEPVNL